MSEIKASQIRGARAMLGWTQKDLAVRSGVAKRSIAGIELETSIPKPATLQRLVATLSDVGIEFQNTGPEAIGVILHLSQKHF